MMEQGINQLIGRGWAFPANLVPRRIDQSGEAKQMGLRWLSSEDKVRQSIWIILSTAPGERLMRPEFGCGIHDLVFQANTAALRGLVAEKVRESLIEFEPRIDVIDVTVESPLGEENRIDIGIDYRIRSNNAVFNLVYPFFLEEGPGS